jgi:hypothetical protein
MDRRNEKGYDPQLPAFVIVTGWNVDIHTLQASA